MKRVVRRRGTEKERGTEEEGCTQSGGELNRYAGAVARATCRIVG